MFHGKVVWRGVVYAILMTMAKLACAVWLLDTPSPSAWLTWVFRRRQRPPQDQVTPSVVNTAGDGTRAANSKDTHHSENDTATDAGHELSDLNTTDDRSAAVASASRVSDASGCHHRSKAPSPTSSSTAVEARSLYPAAMLGSAMVARGEIGFLISSLAESYGVFSDPPKDGASRSEEPSRIYLIVTWAIMTCTIVGPLSVGLLVRRVKRLQLAERAGAGGRADPLGRWGVVQATAS